MDFQTVLNTAEAAEMIGVPAAQLATWRARRCGPAWIKYSRRCVRYQVKDIKAYIRATKTLADEAAVLLQTSTPSGSYPVGTIYFVRTVNWSFVKVGFSKSRIKDRICDLQVACPLKLVLCGAMPGDVLIEQDFHDLLDYFWSYGEWFRIGPQIRMFLERIESGEIKPAEAAR